MTAGLLMALPSSGLDHLLMNVIGRFLRVKIKEHKWRLLLDLHLDQ